METEYEKLLTKARMELPDEKSSGERFEIPKARGHLQGNKTIISNFNEFVSIFHREASHFIKFLQRELAAPAQAEGQRLILGRKIPASLINQKIELYANTFVMCPICRKPDTTLKKEGNLLVMKCTACGAKNPVRAKII